MVSNLSCEKDEISSKLSGTWIEFTNRNDTIDFESLSSEDVFVVRRGYEFHSGYILPKHGSGVYRYKLNSDTIMINNMLWSCLCYPSYYFQMDAANHRFIIGNFYDTTLAVAQPITFIRIK
jgi:hypothetical protein